MTRDDAITDLKQRLAEAEATIAALLSGQVDAVLDGTSETPLLLAKAQDALRLERDRAQRYLDLPDVIMLALGLDGRITLVNRYACEVLGWTADELVGQSWVATCIPLRLRHTFADVFSHMTRFTEYENPVLTKSGEEQLIQWRNSVLRDEAGEVVGSFSSGANITARRQGEAALEKTRADLLEHLDALEQQAVQLTEQAALLDLAKDAIVVRDMENRILFWNRGAQAMYGWHSAETIGKNLKDLLATTFPEPFEQVMSELLRAGHWDGEVVQRTRDGSTLNVAARWTLQRRMDGTPFRILSINHDITGRKRAEADRLGMLQELEAHVAAFDDAERKTNYALSAARMGVWELELRSLRLTWSQTMGPIFGEATGYAPPDLDAYLRRIHPEDRSRVAERLEEAGRAGTDFDEEFRVLWPDGSAHWIGGRARMIRDADDQPLRWLGIGVDVSERRSLEAQFRQAQKMEAVGQLAGGVAHDFNNLLTAILGYSTFVMETLAATDSRRADVEEVIKAGKRATALTRQLLAFSRKQVLQPVALDLNGLVASMQQMLGRLIGEQIDLVAVLAPGLAAVRADPGQLEQVLMNLVVNARDAMPSGGRLALETAEVELDASWIEEATVKPGPYVMLAVSDSGLGMSEATKRRLFEPFFTTKPAGQGTGLGLATVYGIVKQSGGYITVNSDPGAGTTFKVYLPRAGANDAAGNTAAAHQNPTTGTESVLLVEDEDSVRYLARRILEQAGYHVLDAASPQHAEALFAQHPRISLVVTDIVMPGMSGPKLFERLAHSRPGLKVLFMSGYTNDMVIHQELLPPGVELLQKPFTAEGMKLKVREVLDR